MIVSLVVDNTDTDFAIVPFVSLVPIVSKKIIREIRDLSDQRDESEVSDIGIVNCL